MGENRTKTTTFPGEYRLLEVAFFYYKRGWAARNYL